MAVSLVTKFELTQECFIELDPMQKIAMLWLLIKNKIICLFNGYYLGSFKQRAFRYLTLIFSALFFGYLFFWSKKFFHHILNDPEFHLSTIERLDLVEHILSVGFTGFFFFLLVGGLTLSIHYIFSISDLSLLLSTPLSTKTAFTYKIIEMIIFNSALFLFIGGSIMLGFGYGIDAPLSYYVTLVIILIPFVALPTLLALMLTLLALRLIAPHRIREISSVMTGIITLGFWLVIQVFRISTIDARSPDFDPDRLHQLQAFAGEHFWSDFPFSVISAIPMNFLTPEVAFPWLNLTGLIFIVVLTGIFCVKLVETSYLKGVIFTNLAYTKQVRKPLIFDPQRLLSIRRFSVHLNIIAKDIKLIRRDSRLYIQIVLFGMVMLLVPFLVQNSPSQDLRTFLYEPDGFFFVLLFSSITSAQTVSRLIPLESRSFWRLMLSPNPMYKILLSKLALGYSMVQSMSFLALLVLGLYYHVSFKYLLSIFLLSLPLCLGASAIGGLLGILFPRFDWEHPKRMLTPMGGLLLVVFSVIWWALCLLTAFAPWLIFNAPGALQPMSLLSSNILALIVFLGVLWWGSHHLEKMEWLI
ncbi:hypothetical protein JXJ21_03855 [candidate division KSB1 bacterium]|nr:hypothetical protein [candidate division KSB1 bacterium]